jgi:hypothetical protein
MKRLLVCACVVGAMALPATAIANTTISTRSFSGTITDPPADYPSNDVTFKAKVKTTKRPHHPKRVTVTSVKSGMVFDRLLVPCNSGNGVALKDTFGFPFDVKDNKYSFTTVPAPSNGNITHVTGKFTNHGKKASGTVRAHGLDDGNHFDCDSGTQHWIAHTG